MRKNKLKYRLLHIGRIDCQYTIRNTHHSKFQKTHFWMKNVLVVKDSVADLINGKGFSGFRMVELKDFVDEYTFRDTHPYPTLEEMKDRDKKWF